MRNCQGLKPNIVKELLLINKKRIGNPIGKKGEQKNRTRHVTKKKVQCPRI